VAIAAVALAALVLAAGPGTGLSKGRFKTGKYSGKTTQESINTDFRHIQFTVKKGKVTLTAEPVVGRSLCVSTPVFTLDGSIKKPLSGRGAFTFTKTFQGNKIDKIHGRFVSSNKVEGYAIYHFFGSELCSEGKTKVNWSATHAKKAKK
jgi:hypothetical protein